MRSPFRAVVLLVAAVSGAAAAAPRALVLCAPGFPGSTAQAQPTMDAFARFAEGAAGWRPGALRAEYFETDAGGVERLRGGDAALALVTLPFYAKHRDDLGLTPRLQVASEKGATEVWSLVAKKGAVPSPSALDGWEVVGVPGFAPEFVRGPILGGWGRLPESARIVFSSRVASALLKAAAGQKLAVLVDSEQAAALPSHPNATDLEIVASSKPLPASLLCTVGRKAPAREIEALVRALGSLHERAGGVDVLASMRMRRFEPVSASGLDAALGKRAAARAR